MSKWTDKNIKQAPKDFECCWNCRFMIIKDAKNIWNGKGVRCGNKKNEFAFLRLPGIPVRLQQPLVPGFSKKCEYFEFERKEYG